MLKTAITDWIRITSRIRNLNSIKLWSSDCWFIIFIPTNLNRKIYTRHTHDVPWGACCNFPSRMATHPSDWSCLSAGQAFANSIAMQFRNFSKACLEPSLSFFARIDWLRRSQHFSHGRPLAFRRTFSSSHRQVNFQHRQSVALGNSNNTKFIIKTISRSVSQSKLPHYFSCIHRSKTVFY